MTPDVSIFIVNYNTRTFLEECLKSIYDTKQGLNVEVFVADNDSTDGSPDMVEAHFPMVSLTRYSHNLGYTKAINPLLPMAKGKYCLLLHPDIEILRDALGQFVEFFQFHPQAGILGGNLYYPDGSPNPCEVLFPNFRNDLLRFGVSVFKRLPGEFKLTGNSDPTVWSHNRTSEVDGVWNACMMVRKEVFDAVGYFDERFFVWYADWDLCKRAGEVGWKIYYLHPATAIHHERQSFSEEDIILEEVRYKVDGWHSAARQIQDRYVFLKKHRTAASIYGVKAINIFENTLRLWMVLGKLLLQRGMFQKGAFQLTACLKAVQAILKAPTGF
jgi:GT2 family glycosyltransferase